MPKQLLEQVRTLILALTMRQRITIAAAAVTVMALLAFLVNLNKESGFKPLFTNVAGEDAAQVLTKLKEANVEFRLADGGSTIKVPAAKIDELRIAMASSGLPKSGRIGYELFDRTNFGSSEFASFGGWNESKFGVGDITGKSSIEFWTKLKKSTTKWTPEAGINWMS